MIVRISYVNKSRGLFGIKTPSGKVIHLKGDPESIPSGAGGTLDIEPDFLEAYKVPEEEPVK